MKPSKCKQQFISGTTITNGKCNMERTVVGSGPNYGNISAGSGIFKLSYVGENPIKNYFLASMIVVGRFVLIASAGVAIPILVKHGLKKMGIYGEEVKVQDKVLPTNTGNPTAPVPNPDPDEGGFGDDVGRAIANGKPQYLMTPEIIEGSRIILFSGPGIGKSILCNQMGIAIGTGEKCGIFPEETECIPQQVLLIDTEQEDEDLYIRYSNALSAIPDNITRASNCNFNTPEEVATYIWRKVSLWVNNGTVIVDNITSAFSLQSPEKIRLFYGQLKSIQSEMRKRGVRITYIMLCHETKSAKSLTLKSLQGSGNLGNFATAVYGLERAQGENMVKLKVLKNRRSKYNGCAYLEKMCTEPYFHFEFMGIEDDPKSESNASEKDTRNESLISSTFNNQPRKCSEEDIAEMRRLYREEKVSINRLHIMYNINPHTVRKYLGLKH